MKIFRTFVLAALLSLALTSVSSRAEGQTEQSGCQESRAAKVINSLGQRGDDSDSPPPPTRDQLTASGLDRAHPFLSDASPAPNSSIERVWLACGELAGSLSEWLIGDGKLRWVVWSVILAGFLFTTLRSRG